MLAMKYKTVKSAGEYASALHLSLSYLNEAVKEATGFTVSYWIQHEILLEAKRLLYYAIPGAGAFRALADEPARPIVVKRHAASPIRIVGSRSHRGDSLDGLLSRLGSHELIAIGSSLKLCMVAEGSADLYPRLGATSEWDTAAAHAVVLAAGGYVTSTAGTTLTYNSRPELRNPHFLVYADCDRDWHRLL